MADLKLGTTLGGAGIWSASNLLCCPLAIDCCLKGGEYTLRTIARQRRI